MHFNRDDLTMIVRRDELESSSRPVITRSEAQRVLNHLNESNPKADKQWKTRTRRNERALESHDPYQLADVYKSLAKMESQGEALRAADRNALRCSFELLNEELAAALGKSRESVARMIAG